MLYVTVHDVNWLDVILRETFTALALSVGVIFREN